MKKETKEKLKDYLYTLIALVVFAAIVVGIYYFWDAAWNFRKQHPWTIVTSIIGTIIAVFVLVLHSDKK